MGKFCEICEKGTLNGNNVSHSNRKTHRTWAPNVQSVRVVVKLFSENVIIMTSVSITGGILVELRRLFF